MFLFILSACFVRGQLVNRDASTPLGCVSTHKAAAAPISSWVQSSVTSKGCWLGDVGFHTVVLDTGLIHCDIIQ